ncbi:MAG: tRNA (adenosine(37)-N6)-threonylcarbamoyltransferase complex dimerization subunit type 1 TsaB, partial [Verrucomicrobiales bacterium]
MTILALETSTPHASLAVFRGGEIIREWAFQSDRAHNARLFEPLADALDLANPDLLAVGTGPGSYSGIRVAIAAALGVALARRLPLVGWPSLTAFDIPDDGFIIGDARRGGWFIAPVANARLAAPPEIVTREALVTRTAHSRLWTLDASPPLASAVPVVPTAAWLARRVAALSETERTALASVTPEPLYLRAPFITTPATHCRLMRLPCLRATETCVERCLPPFRAGR